MAIKITKIIAILGAVGYKYFPITKAITPNMIKIIF